MRQFRQNGEWNTEGLSLRFALLKHRQPVGWIGMNRRSVG
jgi:hypothetical protein